MERQVLISHALEFIRERQTDLEANIARAINDELRDFEKETELIATGIEIEWVAYRCMEERQGRCIVTGVRLHCSST